MATQHRFRFGVIQETMGSREQWAAQAQRVEDAGFATFLLRDHFVPDFFGDQLAPIVALMAVADATRVLRIGTLVIDNDYRHPVMLAKEAATLDLLSGGRFELGIGAGWLRNEYAQAGMPFDAPGVRISRLAESLHVLKGLFADEPLTFAGEYYAISGLNGYPKPVQRPHPPILIGAGAKRMLRLAGREADIVGILTSSVGQGTLSNDPTERLAETVTQQVAWVREGAGARFDQIELSTVLTLIISNDQQASATQLMRERGWTGVSPEQVLAMPAVYIGTVDQIVEQMQLRREQYGFSYYVVSDKMMSVCEPIVARLAGI